MWLTNYRSWWTIILKDSDSERKQVTLTQFVGFYRFWVDTSVIDSICRLLQMLCWYEILSHKLYYYHSVQLTAQHNVIILKETTSATYLRTLRWTNRRGNNGGNTRHAPWCKMEGNASPTQLKARHKKIQSPCIRL